MMITLMSALPKSASRALTSAKALESLMQSKKSLMMNYIKIVFFFHVRCYLSYNVNESFENSRFRTLILITLSFHYQIFHKHLFRTFGRCNPSWSRTDPDRPQLGRHPSWAKTPQPPLPRHDLLGRGNND